jgi:hypothetical protein
MGWFFIRNRFTGCDRCLGSLLINSFTGVFQVACLINSFTGVFQVAFTGVFQVACLINSFTGVSRSLDGKQQLYRVVVLCNLVGLNSLQVIRGRGELTARPFSLLGF